MQLPSSTLDTRLVCATSGLKARPVDEDDVGPLPPEGWVRVVFHTIVESDELTEAKKRADIAADGWLQAQLPEFAKDTAYAAASPEQQAEARQAARAAVHAQALAEAMDDVEEETETEERILYFSPDEWPKALAALAGLGVEIG